jgi:nicotinate dehydrogenase subunit B
MGILTDKTFSRRTFVKGSGAMVVGFSLAGTAGKAKAADAPAVRSPFPGPPDANQIDSWIQINPDNSATLFTGKIEMGQGSSTSFLQIAAEELDLDVSQLSLHRVDTNWSVNQGFTAGSTSISGGGPQVRAAAAEARQALLNLASANLGVPAAQLSVAKGVVSGGGKSIKYGDLIGGRLFNVRFSGTAPQKKVSDYKVVGQRVPRIEIPDKVTGKYTYLHNVRVPGMLHGRIVRPRGQGAYGTGVKPLSVDESSIKHIAGAQLVRKGDFVGVVAPHEYAAIQAAAQLKVKWQETSTLPGNGDLFGKIRSAQTSDLVQVNTGDVAAGLAQAFKTVKASFNAPYQGHMTIGPNVAIADVTKDGATVLSSSQAVYTLRTNVATLLGVQPTQVRITFWEGSGTYGHSEYDDAAMAAAIMSQAVGKPVRLQLMRWDEHGWDQFGPATAVDINAGIDKDGKIVAFDYASWQQPWISLETTQEQVGVAIPAQGRGNADVPNSGAQYAIPNRRVVGKSLPQLEGFLKTTYLRAPGAPQALFASEQVVDDLAKAAGKDAIEFRKLNSASPRWNGVLDAAASAAKWQPKVAAASVSSANVVTGRGVAIGGFSNTFAAIVAEIEVNRKTGKIAVKHLYGAQDCGLAVNPASVENQIEGCLVQGTSRALYEEVRFSKSRQTSVDWVTYPVLRFKDAPNVTPIVVQRTDLPSSGSGEPTTAPVAAAIANAFFDATGVRLHQYPMTPALVRAALKA